MYIIKQGNRVSCSAHTGLAAHFFGLVCMYLMIGNGQIAQKDHIGVNIDLRAKILGKYKYLVVFES